MSKIPQAEFYERPHGAPPSCRFWPRNERERVDNVVQGGAPQKPGVLEDESMNGVARPQERASIRFDQPVT
jgi:hypothetical protein